METRGDTRLDWLPMLCLYKPYSLRRTLAGGFSEPVRILLTVLRAWLKTRSGDCKMQRSAEVAQGHALGRC